MRWWLAVCCFLIVLMGCDKAGNTAATQFSGIDITGADYGKALKLTDHTGKVRTLQDYQGKVVLVFFGFTQCPEICPTTLHDLASVMKQLGSDADRVQVLFVTLDPERDTQDLLAKFVPVFHPNFVALRGNDAETKAAAQSFHVFFEKRPGTTPENYTIEHLRIRSRRTAAFADELRHRPRQDTPRREIVVVVNLDISGRRSDQER
jgi:protein SCO1